MARYEIRVKKFAVQGYLAGCDSGKVLLSVKMLTLEIVRELRWKNWEQIGIFTTLAELNPIAKLTYFMGILNSDVSHDVFLLVYYFDSSG